MQAVPLKATLAHLPVDLIKLRIILRMLKIIQRVARDMRLHSCAKTETGLLFMTDVCFDLWRGSQNRKHAHRPFGVVDGAFICFAHSGKTLRLRSMQIVILYQISFWTAMNDNSKRHQGGGEDSRRLFMRNLGMMELEFI